MSRGTFDDKTETSTKNRLPTWESEQTIGTLPWPWQVPDFSFFLAGQNLWNSGLLIVRNFSGPVGHFLALCNRTICGLSYCNCDKLYEGNIDANDRKCGKNGNIDYSDDSSRNL